MSALVIFMMITVIALRSFRVNVIVQFVRQPVTTKSRHAVRQHVLGNSLIYQFNSHRIVCLFRRCQLRRGSLMNNASYIASVNQFVFPFALVFFSITKWLET